MFVYPNRLHHLCLNLYKKAIGFIINPFLPYSLFHLFTTPLYKRYVLDTSITINIYVGVVREKQLFCKSHNYTTLTMPQLLPFYFTNQFVFALFALFTITYVMSVYVLPYFTALFVSRVYITKLQLSVLQYTPLIIYGGGARVAYATVSTIVSTIGNRSANYNRSVNSTKATP